MTNPIYYLALPYSSNPKLSQGMSENYTNRLIELGHIMFSPVMHTHTFDINMQKKHKNVNQPWLPPDYVAWDLKIMEGFMKEDGGCEHNCPVCGKKLYSWNGGKNIIYRCMSTGPSQYEWNGPKFVENDHGEWNWKTVPRKGFDSGVILLLSNTAYFVDSEQMDDLYKRDFALSIRQKTIWNSEGCRKEYEFAKSHHIRVLELEAFLEGKEVDL